MNKNAINVFMKSMAFLQDLNESKSFKLFEKLYKNSIKRFFRHCAVSICFRIHLKDKNMDIKALNMYLDSYVGEMLNIKHFECFLKGTYANHADIFDIDILFIKRLPTDRDRYSGHIAFPDGKVEKTDLSDYHTAVRETEEEIGIILNKHNDEDIYIKYIGPNINFDLTIDFKFFVSSHIFLIIDPFKELKLDKISQTEVAEAFFVPLDFFLSISQENQINFMRNIIKDQLGSKMNIGKLILNNREDFLLFGMTLRKLIGVINIGESHIAFREILEFQDNRYKNLVLSLMYPFCKFLTNPYRVYSLIKFTILALLSYKLLNYIIMRIKF
jgi:8-oxo-dGTP pyrophosphatase MutT (NUDIX family)